MVQEQVSSQFKDYGPAGRKDFSLFPTPDGVTVHPNPLGKLLLGKVRPLAKVVEELSKGIPSFSLLINVYAGDCPPHTNSASY